MPTPALQPDPATTAFIEACGGLMTESGLPRSIGRVLGLLLICEPAHQSAAAIGHQLQLSSGSVSTATTMLQKISIVSRLTLPGDRHLYYRVDPDYERNILELRLRQIQRGVQVVDTGLRLRPADPRLLSLRHIYTELARHMRQIQPRQP